MCITKEQREALLHMDRAHMIDHLCATGYISTLSKEQQGLYLFGKTGNDRAICLIGKDDNNGYISRDILVSAYHEIANAGLKIPFLFFGLSSDYVALDLFTFCQIPYFFEERSNLLLRTLQGMNMRGDLRPLIIS